MTTVIETLNKLKGVLLLDSIGTIYLLKDYEYEESTPVEIRKPSWHSWYTGHYKESVEVHSFVSSLQFSNLQGKLVYDYVDQHKLVKRVNDMVDDRNRYLRLQRSLKAIGAVIITKK